MKIKLGAAAAAGILALSAPAAQAQMVVHDPTSYAKLIAQAQTALDQLNELKAQVQQGRELFDSLNAGSAVGTIAPQLGAQAVREFLPDVSTLTRAAKGDLSGLGRIGARAGAIRAEGRLYTPPEDDDLAAGLEAAGNRAARDLALSEAVGEAGETRLEGLQALQTAITDAPNARAVLDLQARAMTEQAMIANDQMRLQGLALAQAAEARLQKQRDQERARAESAARMALYRSRFE